jgi:hypothetical protein
MKTVYVYQENCDNDPFEEKITKVFSSQEAARDFLAKRVGSYFGVRFDEVETLVDPETDRYSMDRVVVYDDIDTRYWLIEEHKVE